MSSYWSFVSFLARIEATELGHCCGLRTRAETGDGIGAWGDVESACGTADQVIWWQVTSEQSALLTSSLLKRELKMLKYTVLISQHINQQLGLKLETSYQLTLLMCC